MDNLEGLRFDAIRFTVGPWNGRYSSVWRIWSADNAGDVYLGVRSLLRYFKISLHESGDFRAAHVSRYNQKLKSEGMDRNKDRAFFKWTQPPIPERGIIHSLDIHFPLIGLSLDHCPKTGQGVKLVVFQPHKETLGIRDTVTVMILYHKICPESGLFESLTRERKIFILFSSLLKNEVYISIGVRYSNTLPITISKNEQNSYARMLHNHFERNGRKVGDHVDDITIQTYKMGRPPAIYNIGRISATWVNATHFSMGVTD